MEPLELYPIYIPYSAGDQYIAVIHEKDAKKLNLHAGDRIKLKILDKEVIAIVDIAKNNFPEGHVGIYYELYQEIESYLEYEELIKIEPTKPPSSLAYIKEKLEGKKLDPYQIHQIIKDITSNKLSNSEIAMWVTTTYTKKFSKEEIISLVLEVAYSGDIINWETYPILDKHCIGGIPNNRTTPIVVPILAAIGYKVPKTSSRAITSPAGTADVVEVFTNVKLTIDEIKEIVNKVGGVLAWGGALNIAPADSKMIKARYPLRLDPLPLLLASILGKKKAVGSTHVLIDIPYGKEAKVKNILEAFLLKLKFKEIGKAIGLKLEVTLTKGEEPIGRGIGPVLEAIDIFKILQNKKGPEDLTKKSIYLAQKALKLVGHKNYADVNYILYKGKAWKKLKEIIEAQGGDPNITIDDLKSKLGSYEYKIVAEKDGIIKYLSNKKISEIAHILGNPKHKGAGIYLNKKVGEKVKKGEPIAILYAESEFKLSTAIKEIEENPFFIY